MTAPLAPPNTDLETRDSALYDALQEELRRLLPNGKDPTLRSRCIAELNRWLARGRTGTFAMFLRRGQGIIRATCHPARRLLAAEELKIDPKLIPSPRVREEAEHEMRDTMLSTVDLERIHAGLAELKKTGKPGELPPWTPPWGEVFSPLYTIHDRVHMAPMVTVGGQPHVPTDGFTPTDFLRLARETVAIALARYD